MDRKWLHFITAILVLIALVEALPAKHPVVPDPKASPDLKTEESHGYGYGYPGYYSSYGLYGGYGGYGGYYPYYGYGHYGGYPYYGSYGYYW